jgi:choice-of-anchor B domain-containing protein
MKHSYKLLLPLLLAGSNLFSQASLNVTFQSQLPYPGQTCANVCGYVDSLGNEYALVGASQGMSIVDITNPASPNEVAQIPNIDDLWKEIKVYRGFAYVTTEGGGGLQIVDMRGLPNTTLPYHAYTGDGAINGQLGSIHALHIDTTKGFCYLFGTNLFNGGAVVLYLNSDPYNPTYAGKYDQLGYVHDGYVDNDTLFAGHIYAGYFAEVDMTIKTAPVVLGTQTTPTAFTHNTWISNDRDYLFTTDENSNSYLASYDVNDPQNYVEKDRIQSYNPGSGSIVHNTHILDNWAITSWYKDGFVITDVTRPHNLVHVGYYDTYAGSGGGFEGAWGVYPFFPSGTIVVTNINEGLFVFSPNYVRACYLEGVVTDSVCGSPLTGVTITISSVNVTDQTDLTGNYATGTAIPGTYNVTYSKTGYQSQTFNNVSFSAGAVTMLNVALYSSTATPVSGNVSDATTTSALPNTQVLVTNPSNTYNYVSDVSGNFSSCNVIAGTYTVAAADWGYYTYCSSTAISSASNTLPIAIDAGYEDDFTFDLGWTASGTASAGQWERGEPVGTFQNAQPVNPDVDVSGDCMDQCYVTGNNGGSASQDDVDNGSTTLTSPVFDLTAYNDPWIHYDRWFVNAGGSGNPNDSLKIMLTNGTTTMLIETVTAASLMNGTWVHSAKRVSTYMTPTANMQIMITAADVSPGHLVEGGFDHFLVVDSNAASVATNQVHSGLLVYPNPFTGMATVQYALTSQPVANAYIEFRDITGRLVSTQAITAREGTVSIGADLSAGVYFVRVMNGTESSEAIRLVKGE